MIAEYTLICTVALVVAGLTFVSGFGLGTLLLPAFALFFAPEIAVAATAMVHLANSLFKVALIGKWAHWPTVLRFALPAAIAASLGAYTLDLLGHLPVLYQYQAGSRVCSITPLKLLLAALIITFAALEFSSRLERLTIPPRFVPLGGILSGFFGGLSGHQGALRTAFLIRLGLSKEQLIGTRAVCAVVIDSTRLVVYGVTFIAADWNVLRSGGVTGLVIAASFSAFAGSLLGMRLLRNITLRTVERAVAVCLTLLAVALASGLL